MGKNQPSPKKQHVPATARTVIQQLSSHNTPFDGARTYKLPPNILIKDFWSMVVYDNQTHSILRTDQQDPRVDSQKKDAEIDADAVPPVPLPAILACRGHRMHPQLISHDLARASHRLGKGLAVDVASACRWILLVSVRR
jgi:hypothetical protein